MPFRERVKRAFTRSSNSSNSSTSSKSSNSSSTNSPFADPSIIYQPGEKMPQPKYRRPVAKDHKEKLESFSFDTAWRRKSHVSLYSPMGSRMPSRRNSFNYQTRRPVEADLDEGTDEEGDVRNVGISRRPSKDFSDLSSMVTGSRDTPAQTDAPTHPFNAEDLTLALKRSNLDH